MSILIVVKYAGHGLLIFKSFARASSLGGKQCESIMRTHTVVKFELGYAKFNL